EVEDDIGGILYDAGDRLKFVQHAFDLDSGDGCALNRTEQYAPQSVADGGAEAALKRLCPKHAVFVSQVLGVDGETFRFLKAFPKHCFLHSAIWLSHGSPNRPEFGSSAVTGGSGTKNGPKLSHRSLVIGRQPLAASPPGVELRSAGQPRTAVPTCSRTRGSATPHAIATSSAILVSA